MASDGRARLWLRALAPVGILVGAWLIFVAYAYPGLMSVDSFDQLGEGRAWFFTDSHPPAMAALWGIVDRIIPGPFGMLAIQTGCFLAGAYLIVRRALGPVPAAIAASLVLLFPPVGVSLAVIWKDCQMAGFLALGIGLLMHGRRAGLALLLLGTAMRYNAFAATLPLVVLLFEWRPGLTWIQRHAIAFAAWLAITAAAIGLNSWLTTRQMHFWASSFALVDITGTLAKLEPDLPDAELAPLLAPTGIQVDHDFHATVREHYTPGDFTKVVGPAPNLWGVTLGGDEPLPAPQREAIGHAWREIVLGHPRAYLRYRFDSFAEVLGLRRKFAGTVLMPRHWQHEEPLERFAITQTEPPLAEAYERAAWWVIHHTPFARPWCYALLAISFLWLARRDREVLALLLSGLVLEASLVFLAVTPDYRYSHWLVVVTCLALVLLVARRARR